MATRVVFITASVSAGCIKGLHFHFKKESNGGPERFIRKWGLPELIDAFDDNDNDLASSKSLVFQLGQGELLTCIEQRSNSLKSTPGPVHKLGFGECITCTTNFGRSIHFRDYAENRDDASVEYPSDSMLNWQGVRFKAPVAHHIVDVTLKEDVVAPDDESDVDGGETTRTSYTLSGITTAPVYWNPATHSGHRKKTRDAVRAVFHSVRRAASLWGITIPTDVLVQVCIHMHFNDFAVGENTVDSSPVLPRQAQVETMGTEDQPSLASLIQTTEIQVARIYAQAIQANILWILSPKISNAMTSCDTLLDMVEDMAELQRDDEQLYRVTLEALIPILIRSMRFTAAEIATLKADDIEQCNLLDSQSLDDIDDEKPLSPWNFRKNAASVLDTLAVKTESMAPTTNFIYPVLKEIDRLFASHEWEHCECAALVLGAIAQGIPSADYFQPHIPVLIGKLIQGACHPNCQLRSVSCWSLSRYSSWLFSHDAGKDLLRQVYEVLPRVMLSRDFGVQTAACSAMASFAENAMESNHTVILEFIPQIVKTLSVAFAKYSMKNNPILADVTNCLFTMCSDIAPGDSTLKTDFKILIPDLLRRWKEAEGVEDLAEGLIECMSSFAETMGVAFSPYQEEVHSRCCNVFREFVKDGKLIQDVTPENQEPLSLCLSLLSCLSTGALKTGKSLVNIDNERFAVQATCVFAMKEEPSIEIDARACAFFGDYAKNCPMLIEEFQVPIFIILINKLTRNQPDQDFSVKSNAVWALSCIARALGAKAKPLFSWPFMETLVPFLKTPPITLSPTNLRCNTSIAIGVLMELFPEHVGPQLPDIATEWCAAVEDIEAPQASLTSTSIMEEHYDERWLALQGMCKGLASDFDKIEVCDTIRKVTINCAKLQLAEGKNGRVGREKEMT